MGERGDAHRRDFLHPDRALPSTGRAQRGRDMHAVLEGFHFFHLPPCEFFQQTNFLFVGGMIVALAVEESRLHERIALRTLLLVGSRPPFIMLGFMLVTAFLCVIKRR